MRYCSPGFYHLIMRKQKDEMDVSGNMKSLGLRSGCLEEKNSSAIVFQLPSAFRCGLLRT
jgi:hypothetical protein